MRFLCLEVTYFLFFFWQLLLNVARFSLAMASFKKPKHVAVGSNNISCVLRIFLLVVVAFVVHNSRSRHIMKVRVFVHVEGTCIEEVLTVPI
jgi:hypothetical protein